MRVTKFHRQVFFMELRKLITYRADFWVNFIGQTILALVIAYYLWVSIFEYSQTQTLKGHNIQYMIFYYLIVPLIFRIQQGQGIRFLSREIYEGGLNKYLLYPIDIFEFKISTYFANSFFYFIQLLFILIIYNLFFYDPSIYSFSILNLTIFILTTIVSTLSFFYFFTLAELMAFWFDNTWTLGVMLRFSVSFLGGALIPLSFFPEWANQILVYTPFPYFIDFPLNCLVGSLSALAILKNLLISISWLFFFRQLCLMIWKKGQLSYSGVGI